MPVTFSYDSGRNILNVRPSGVLDVKTIGEYVKGVLLDESIAPGVIAIVDFADVEDFQISFMQAVELPAAFHAMKEKLGHVGSVLAARTDLQFGIARMAATVLEGRLDVRVVCTEDEVDAEVAALRSAAIRC